MAAKTIVCVCQNQFAVILICISSAWCWIETAMFGSRLLKNCPTLDFYFVRLDFLPEAQNKTDNSWGCAAPLLVWRCFPSLFCRCLEVVTEVPSLFSWLRKKSSVIFFKKHRKKEQTHQSTVRRRVRENKCNFTWAQDSTGNAIQDCGQGVKVPVGAKKVAVVQHV